MLYNHIDDLPHMPHNLRVEVECRAQGGTDWSKTFAAVACRYHHLQSGTPREYLKLPMPDMTDNTIHYHCRCDGQPGYQCIYCTFVCARCGEFFFMNALRTGLQQDWSYPSDFRTPDPMWCYSQEDALLVYPAGWLLEDGATPAVNWTKVDCESQSKADAFRHHFNPPTPSCGGFFYRLFDPETGEHISVPFDVRGRIIRRVRLAQGVLVLEWIQARVGKTAIDADEVIGRNYKYWQNARGGLLVCNDHMVTVFDVVRTPLSPDMKCYPRRQWTWAVRLRWEWKLPSGGSVRSNFRQEYDTPRGMYRSLPRFLSAHTATHYALLIWEHAASAGDYHLIRQLYVWNICQAGEGGTKSNRSRPILVRRSVGRDILPHLNTSDSKELLVGLRGIALDEHNVYLAYDRCTIGAIGIHAVTSYGVPVIPFTPTRPGRARPSSDRSDHVNTPVLGPQRVDFCPIRVGTVASDDPSFLGVVDQFCRHSFLGSSQSCAVMPPAPYSSLPEPLLPSLWNRSYPWNVSDAATNPLQPRDLPSFGPCWRHESTPYFGLSAVTDYGAGVRWIARDAGRFAGMFVGCDSVLPPKVVTVNISGRRRPTDDRPGIPRDDLSSFQPLPKNGNIREDEVEVECPGFADNMLGRSTLAGDERWLIGQDLEHRVMLVRF